MAEPALSGPRGLLDPRVRLDVSCALLKGQNGCAPFPSWSSASLIAAYAPVVSSIWEDDNCGRFSRLPAIRTRLRRVPGAQKTRGADRRATLWLPQEQDTAAIQRASQPPTFSGPLKGTEPEGRGARLDWRSSGRVSYPRLSLRKRGNPGFLRNGRKDIWSVVGARTPKSSYSLQVSGWASRHHCYLTRRLLHPGPAF